jgi:hypothetical protein
MKPQLIKSNLVIVSQYPEPTKESAFGMALYSALVSLAWIIRKYYCGGAPGKCEHCGK